MLSLFWLWWKKKWTAQKYFLGYFTKIHLNLVVVISTNTQYWIILKFILLKWVLVQLLQKYSTFSIQIWFFFQSWHKQLQRLFGLSVLSITFLEPLVSNTGGEPKSKWSLEQGSSGISTFIANSQRNENRFKMLFYNLSDCQGLVVKLVS